MFTVEKNGHRTIIRTEPTTEKKSKATRIIELSQEFMVNAASTVITAVFTANAIQNPTVGNILTAMGFGSAGAYIYYLGKKSKFGYALMSQRITLDQDNIYVETDFLGKKHHETYNAQFVELAVDTSLDPNAELTSVIFKYAKRMTPILLPNNANEANRLFDILSSYIEARKKSPKIKPPELK